MGSWEPAAEEAAEEGGCCAERSARAGASRPRTPRELGALHPGASVLRTLVCRHGRVGRSLHWLASTRSGDALRASPPGP